MTSGPTTRHAGSDRPHLAALPFVVIALLALVAVLPLILHGSSCGHDFDFHLQSWLDAASQLRHGTLDPSWTISAAWNAGEPRFLFYPPLSWMLGAVLSLLFPFTAAPVLFTALSLCGSGIAMYVLARRYATPAPALIASAVYLANPYMLFTAYERTAYGELLAAVWLPLLLAAVLSTRPTAIRIGVPLALLWLSNAPAAVIGMYTVAGFAFMHALLVFRQTRAPANATSLRIFTRSLLPYIGGVALGLALPAFYLLPAAYERQYIQVAMAIIPNMRVQDNFLFEHTGDGPHDQVLHTASLLAISLLILTTTILVAAWWRSRPTDSARHRSTSSLLPKALLRLAISTGVIALLLTPLSLPLWLHLPELAFLQFPWRLMCLLGVLLALAMSIALRGLSASAGTYALSILAAFVFVSTVTAISIRNFRQPCDALDGPAARQQLFSTHHGVSPTDEYTPVDADNDVLRWDDPAYWSAFDPAEFAPGTVPNPAASIVNYDAPPPIQQTVAGIVPHRIQVDLPQPRTLILNLRDYPAWQITRNGRPVLRRLQRDDGLIAIALPAGRSVIDIRWHRTWDQCVGDLVSVAALALLAIALLRSRTIRTDA